MRAIYILAEGSTEEEFIKSILTPYFHKEGIYDIRCILMNTSPGFKGGDISYGRLKRNADLLLKQQRDIIVTSLIDFFRLKPDFPGYEEAKQKYPDDKFQRVSFLENALADSINHPRFIPYIQLHEFESLLFSSTDGFEILPDLPHQSKSELIAAVELHPNPELLNDGETTSPSKRLQNLIPGYQKVKHGIFIAEKVSIGKMLEKCERFRNWIESLIDEYNK